MYLSPVEGLGAPNHRVAVVGAVRARSPDDIIAVHTEEAEEVEEETEHGYSYVPVPIRGQNARLGTVPYNNRAYRPGCPRITKIWVTFWLVSLMASLISCRVCRSSSWW